METLILTKLVPWLISDLVSDFS